MKIIRLTPMHVALTGFIVPTPGTYLVLLRRFRLDYMPSGWIINIRGKVVGKLRDQERLDLERNGRRRADGPRSEAQYAVTVSGPASFRT